MSLWIFELCRGLLLVHFQLINRKILLKSCHPSFFINGIIEKFSESNDDSELKNRDLLYKNWI
jgi:hypothetical protein